MIKSRSSSLALIALFVGLSCDGPQQATGIRGFPDASEIIADGAHGGNPDFFFLPPMVPPPYQHADFERGKFNARLQPSLKIEICELVREPLDLNLPATRPKTTTACEAKPLIEVFAPGSVDLVGVPAQQSGWWSNFNMPSDGFYKVLWDTRPENLSLDKYYRVKVLLDGSDEPLGYADVDPVSNMREWKHVATGELVTMIDDTKLPIVFRVERGALCEGDTDCGSATLSNTSPDGSGTQILQVIDENGEAVAGVKVPDGWLPLDGPQSVVVTIARVNTGTNNVSNGTQSSPCHANLPLQQFDGCFHFSTTPELEPIDESGRQFAESIIGAVCFVLHGSADPREPFVQLWSSEPDEEGDTPKALRSADATGILTHGGETCGESEEEVIASKSNNVITQFARAGWRTFKGGVGRFLGVKTAYAVDLGLGGILDDFSNVGPAMSAEIQRYTSTGLTLPGGSTTTSTARVVGTRKHDGTAFNTGIGGVAVTFSVAPGNGTLNALGTTGGSATQVTVTTNTNPIDPENPTSGGGFAPVNWTLPTAPGTYTLTATARARGGPVTFTATVPAPPLPIVFASSLTNGTGPSSLYTVEIGANGVDTRIGTISTTSSQPTISDIALLPGGSLRGVSFSQLYSIDRQSGAAVFLEQLPRSDVNGLAANANGVLYASTIGGELLRRDPEEGWVVQGAFGAGLGSSGDLAFAPNGTLYGSLLSSGVNVLASINVSTGAATVIAPAGMGFSNVWGLTFVGSNLYGFTNTGSQGSLVQINPGTGTATSIRSIGFGAGGSALRRIGDFDG